ncbi:3-oxoacyl-[acyl-carrier protein] reductase [Streptoalloteichus tenebrarius]|uniref:3-oxoacyl-[acyl-carrier protein] reductase n=1 Tax=Streptoalloteichus tenebrarius (strain ATCC 17920 / DSM 40477 / JCM 4838 / CBS 697.72 / NBRC 16177 / NCIMB 11028 / NRRL B-12390 / A12253. 1 / ISP 5477) TaxID=1933 RepID=A0ABT1HV79_STRSD|nr:SDR family oxidoreductase [Streptoalloteichus tenebrarius]MCP2259419.1 3-oxoacyl-[acyl-carrier protein] reductase [Streptoalloteichus tenebrarius]BFF02362.1 SDR family oxidoreductase [Streptoalloteichus tenebrarius]
MEQFPLRGRVALVTGVSRRIGIAYALTRRLAAWGADVLAHSWAPHDAEQPWGEDPLGAEGVLGHLRSELPKGAGRVVGRSGDLGDPTEPAAAVDAAVAAFGAIDVLVATHARSSLQDLAGLTVAELDACWAVNVRGTLLLARRYAEVRDHSRPGGRVVWFTSGQHLDPMPGELPYAVSKGALHQLTLSLAAEFAPRGVTVNCVNPGPVDTGYADEATYQWVRERMPFGRWGRPDDVADLVGWLVSDAVAWMTGRILDHDGGWSLRVQR